MTSRKKYSFCRHLCSFLVLCVLIPLCQSGCAHTSGPADMSSVSRDDSPAPVWPPPPQTPRIRYTGSISGPSDIAIKKSWFKKTIDALFGEEEFEDSMLRPYGVCARGSRIYVTDPGFGLVHVFDTENREYFRIARADDDNAFVSPIGISADQAKAQARFPAPAEHGA